MIDYDKAPKHGEAIRRYVEEGGYLGDFLTALLSNDFAETVGRADSYNADHLKEWAVFVYNELPASCWGSRETVEAWQEQGGLNAMREEL